MGATPKRSGRRAFWTLHVRVLMIGVLVVGGWLGWLSRGSSSARICCVDPTGWRQCQLRVGMERWQASRPTYVLVARLLR